MHPPSKSTPHPLTVDSTEELEAVCGLWSSSPALAIDTEFVRTRTFYPRLGLIQIATPQACYLVDAVAIDDLRPLWALLSDPGVVKVLHSSGEDLEVFFHLFGAFPRPLFDTQVAATLAGYGYSLGYQRLVQILWNLDVPKEETRSNWLQRPLTPSQEEYAARDVAYLLPIYDVLGQQLACKGREEWLAEECERLEANCRFNLDPDKTYLRIKRASSLPPRELAILRALSAWREGEARARDLPRGFVMQEKVMLDLVSKKPSDLRELAQIPGLAPGELRRNGSVLLARIRGAKNLPSTTPAPKPAFRLPPNRRKRWLERMREMVRRTAQELDLPAEFLVQRRVVAQLLTAFERGDPDPLPSGLTGWRRPVIGKPLLDLAEEMAYHQATGRHLRRS